MIHSSLDRKNSTGQNIEHEEPELNLWGDIGGCTYHIKMFFLPSPWRRFEFLYLVILFKAHMPHGAAKFPPGKKKMHSTLQTGRIMIRAVMV